MSAAPLSGPSPASRDLSVRGGLGPVCGNGVVERGEECDDGNEDDHPCNQWCTLFNPALQIDAGVGYRWTWPGDGPPEPVKRGGSATQRAAYAGASAVFVMTAGEGQAPVGLVRVWDRQSELGTAESWRFTSLWPQSFTIAPMVTGTGRRGLDYLVSWGDLPAEYTTADLEGLFPEIASFSGGAHAGRWSGLEREASAVVGDRGYTLTLNNDPVGLWLWGNTPSARSDDAWISSPRWYGRADFSTLMLRTKDRLVFTGELAEPTVEVFGAR